MNSESFQDSIIYGSFYNFAEEIKWFFRRLSLWTLCKNTPKIIMTLAKLWSQDTGVKKGFVPRQIVCTPLLKENI